MTEPLDWPRLVGVCERQGIPVSRVDDRGVIRLIRSRQQLAAEWEPATTTEGSNA